MLSEYYEQIEAVALDVSLLILFILMGLAIHDVLKKNDVPKLGRYITYGVLLLGAAGFVVKGIIQFVLAS
ncbi:DUF2788 domain-containing protein [Neptunicella sp. SCSIO 80796]|uniref:DUF2788 domain-containing protein n=1 Tax=Neptunicella plasticusilytica TaxID=3117012 RepID=UPI003A4D9CE7